MKNIFKKLFGNDLCALGKKGNSSKFAGEFIRAEITLLALPIPDSVDPTGLTPDQLLALVKKAVTQMSIEKTITPFSYPEAGVLITPVFTSYAAAEEFVKLYINDVRLLIPFEVLSLSGLSLARHLSEEMTIVINARSRSEYQLSSEDVFAIQQAVA